jgi:conjugative transposon TraN protein
MRKVPTSKTLIFLVFATNLAFCQTENNISNPEMFMLSNSKYKLPIGKIAVKGSYPLAISDSKTVHVVFPTKIREVDTGTPNILVQITESFDNVLRIKSINLPEKLETNITVLTEDGGLYSFLTTYAKNPEILNINIGKNETNDANNAKELGLNAFPKLDFLEEKLGQSLVNIENNMEKTLDKKSFIKNVGEKSQNMTVLLKGIYNALEMQYYKLEIANHSEVNYAIDFVKLYIKDIENLSKTAIQSEELAIIKMVPTETNIKANNTQIYILATKMKTLPIDKNLEIEIYEKNGGRHIRFPVDNVILSKSKAL